MIAADDPLVRRHAARDFRNHVVNRLDIPIRCDFQMDPRRPRSDVIWNRKRAAPPVRRHGPRQGGEQRLRVAVRNREHRNFRDALRLLPRQALGIGCRADSGRQRITRARRSKIHNAAALHSIHGAHRPQRKHIVARVAVVLWFRINQAANGSMLGGNFRFHAAP